MGFAHTKLLISRSHPSLCDSCPRLILLVVAALLSLTAYPVVAQSGPAEFAGKWNCALKSAGGDLRFGLEIETSLEGATAAFVTNGHERIQVPSALIDDGKLSLQFTHYDSEITCKSQIVSTGLEVIDERARVESDSRADSDFRNLHGIWRKRRGLNEWVEMKFQATADVTNKTPNNPLSAQPFAGRWSVKFEQSTDPAVAEFSVNEDGSVSGTFLTTTGDYRFLHGEVVEDKLVLSCFDGAHAFLFRATLQSNEKLVGEFWSSNTWHEKWTAERNPNAVLSDPFIQTKLVAGKSIGSYSFPDLQGISTRLDDPRFAGQAKLIYVFGSWCPNCHDAAAYFLELQNAYSDEQLSILGLAFELTGDFDRDAAQVKQYLHRHGVDYPVLIAGQADKALATQVIPFLDKVRSYPTTIFLDANHKVKAIHTGFTGPATGEAYSEMKTKFKTLIDSIIADAG